MDDEPNNFEAYAEADKEAITTATERLDELVDSVARYHRTLTAAKRYAQVDIMCHIQFALDLLWARIANHYAVNNRTRPLVPEDIPTRFRSSSKIGGMILTTLEAFNLSLDDFMVLLRFKCGPPPPGVLPTSLPPVEIMEHVAISLRNDERTQAISRLCLALYQ